MPLPARHPRPGPAPQPAWRGPRVGDAAPPGPTPGRIARSDRHFLILPDLALAFARVPKAANSTIRYRLAAELGLKGDGLRPNNDAFWLDLPPQVARCLTRRQFAHLPEAERPWCFTVVRHPVARLWSAWNNKVIENDVLYARIAAMGVRHGMSFDAFVERVAETRDADCDIHVRAQWAILAVEGRLLPDFVARTESLDTDWAAIRSVVRKRAGRTMGKLQAQNVRARATPEIAARIAPSTLALIRARYARDFAAFYPDG